VSAGISNSLSLSAASPFIYGFIPLQALKREEAPVMDDLLAAAVDVKSTLMHLLTNIFHVEEEQEGGTGEGESCRGVYEGGKS
jgi:hypothetical protein